MKKLALLLAVLALASCAHGPCPVAQRFAPNAPEPALGPDSWAARNG